jgi:hypothetical protein
MQEAEEEVDRGRVGPVEVIENENQGLGGGQPLEQLTNRTVHPVALVLDADGGTPSKARE